MFTIMSSILFYVISTVGAITLYTLQAKPKPVETLVVLYACAVFAIIAGKRALDSEIALTSPFMRAFSVFPDLNCLRVS